MESDINEWNKERYISTLDPNKNIFRPYRDSKSNLLRLLTGQEFINIWKWYDKNGNGYIEDKELEQLLADIIISLIPETYIQVVSREFFQRFKTSFMEAYDDNRNGRIEIKEFAQLVPIEDDFSFIFDSDHQVKSSVYFMKLWKKYDADNSGFIDSSELSNLIRDFYHKVKRTHLDPAKLTEISNIILSVFDSNNDGKLQIDELSKLFPVETNFLRKIKLFRRKKIKSKVITRIFDKYDVDGNGFIENEELEGLLKDLMELQNEDYDLNQIEDVKQYILRNCDADKDGSISKKELLWILNSLNNTYKKSSKRNKLRSCLSR